MKVLSIASSGNLGGAELSLAEFLRHRPPGVEATCLLLTDGPLRLRLEQQGLTVFVARGYEGRPSLTGMARFTRSLRRLLAETSPGVVWATGLRAATFAVPACRAMSIPLVWHKVDFSLDRALTLPLGAAVNGVVSVSEAAAAALGPLRRRRLLSVVGPPVRLPDDLHVAPNQLDPTVGTLATLMPYKGLHHIIEAAALLSEEFPRTRVILGGGASPHYPDYPAELTRLSESLGIADRVDFVGFVNDVTEVLARLTVFVNATYEDEQGFGREGLSGAMLEAGWAGLPVVATRGGGTPEGMLDGITGALAEPADPASLARSIAPYLRDATLARKAGEAGREFTRDHFAPELVAARLFRTLDDVARRRRRTSAAE